MSAGKIEFQTLISAAGFKSGLANIAKIGTAAIAGAATAIAGLAAQGVKYNAAMEGYLTNFTTLLKGNAQGAATVLEELKTLAAETPLELQNLSKSAQTLLAFGAADESNLTDTLRMIGDVALGDAQKMDALSLAYGQMTSTGKLMGQDLLQMINAGFNPLVELEKMGYGTVAELKEQMAQGAISVEMVQDAFKHATQEGGQFYNAMEAQAKTFNGQLSSLKDNANAVLGELTTGISDSLAQEVMPMANAWLEQLLTATREGGIQGAIDCAGSVIAELVSYLVSSAPNLIATANNLIIAFLQGLIGSIPTIAEGAAQIVLAFADGLLTMLPLLISGGIQLIAALAKGLASALPTLIPQVVQMLLAIVNTLIQNIPLIIEAGLAIINGLIDGIFAAIPALIEMLPTLILTIVETLLENAPLLIDASRGIIQELIAGIITAIPTLIEMLPQIIEAIVTTLIAHLPDIINAAIELIVALVSGIVQSITVVVSAIGQLIASILTALGNAIDSLIQKGLEFIRGIWQGFSNWVSTFATNVSNWVKGIVEKIGNWFKGVKDVGKNIVHGIWDGICGAADWLLRKVKEWCGSILDGIKSFFGINSPARVLRIEVGRMLPPGIGLGFEDEMPALEKDVTSRLNSFVNRMRASVNDMQMNAAISGYTPALTGGPSSIEYNTRLEQTIYTHDSLSESELTQEAENLLDRAKWKVK